MKNRLRGNLLFKIIDRYIGVPIVWGLGMIAVKPKREPAMINRILVIKLSAMGDTVLLIPALRNLRKSFPDAKIDMVCTKINRDVVKDCPYIDKFHVLDINGFIKNPLPFIRLLKSGSYDVALDFDQWLRLTPIISFLSAAKYRYGFKTEGQGRHFLYTNYVIHARERHEVDSFLDILGLIGVTGTDNYLEYWIDEASQKKADSVLKELHIDERTTLVILHPETPAHGAQRQWPVEKYIELGKTLSGSSGIRIAFSGTAKDWEQNSAAAAKIQGAVVLPPLNLDEFAAVLKRCSCFVCGNTGVMHLACAIGTPVVALHGPTNPVKWGPAGDKNKVIRSRLECSPCLYLGFEYGCGTHRCMNSIETPEVVRAVESFIAKSL